MLNADDKAVVSNTQKGLQQLIDDIGRVTHGMKDKDKRQRLCA